ncbi:MAG: M24 family metallopeptidase [Candidatus Zixiibacteriota bacterium]
MDIVKEKIAQAQSILNELDIDLWLIFCRETDMMADPALELVVGHKVVWQSAFFIPRKGKTMALVGNFDASDFEKSGRFEIVQPYIQDCGLEIKKTIKKYDPSKLALNFSKNDVSADGLSYGMYLLLLDYLGKTVYNDRIISSENIISLLRGRKTDSEIGLLTQAAKAAHKAWEKSISQIKTGQTELEISEIIQKNIEKTGGTNSFDTIVNAGAKTAPGHGHPTSAVLEPGDLLHVDMGVKLNDYCSDIQRLAYFKRPGELSAPQNLLKAFEMVKRIIDETSKLYLPGKKGYTIDTIARQILKDNNYEIYQHALGHQIGRSVHDGAAIVGPKWKRYGRTPEIPLEPNNCFTVELGIEVENIGYVGLEEDLVVTGSGGQFLCPRQTELIVK